MQTCHSTAQSSSSVGSLQSCKNIIHFLHPSMRILLIECSKILIYLSPRFMPAPQNSGGDWSFVCGAQSIGKLHLKDSSVIGTVCPSRHNVPVSLDDSQRTLSTVSKVTLKPMKCSRFLTPSNYGYVKWFCICDLSSLTTWSADAGSSDLL